MESVIDIYQEIDELRINHSQDEKLKYMYQTLPEDFRERLRVTLRFTYQQLYEKAKEKLDAKSYLEDWNEKDKDDIDDPMDIDFLSRESGYRRKRSHSKNKKRNPYCNKCKKYGYNINECKYNNNNENYNKNKNRNSQRNKQQGRQVQRKPKQNQKELNLVEIYDDIDTLNVNMDFEDIRPLTIGLVEINELSTQNNTKTINYLGENIVYDEWIYDTGAPEHIVNNKNIQDNFIEKDVILRCANGSPYLFNGIGTYTFKLNDREYKLKQVLYSN